MNCWIKILLNFEYKIASWLLCACLVLLFVSQRFPMSHRYWIAKYHRCCESSASQWRMTSLRLSQNGVCITATWGKLSVALEGNTDRHNRDYFDSISISPSTIRHLNAKLTSSVTNVGNSQRHKCFTSSSLVFEWAIFSMTLVFTWYSSV